MPANLPPQYFEAERVFRQAKTVPEKIEALETMLAIMPKHKGTERLHAELRTRLAKLTEEMEKKATIGRASSAYFIRKEGAGQAALVGLPNAGKSQLLASLTEASPRIADYPFTTQAPLPGMMRFENVQIQIIDLPPIIERSLRGEFSMLLRRVDLVLLVVDLSEDVLSQAKALFEELANLKIKPLGRGLQAERTGPVVAKKALIIGNKSDLPGAEAQAQALVAAYAAEFPVVGVSARERLGLEKLAKEVFLALDLVRIYTKTKGEEVDRERPFLIPRGSTIEELAEAIHKDLRRKLKYAQVWGSGKFEGQQVPRTYVPQDGDIVELHT